MACAGPPDSFFKTLRDGISSINKSVTEVEEQAKVSIVDLPENIALVKLVNLTDEVKEMKLSAEKMTEELKKSNSRYSQYCKHMESLVNDMEEKSENVVNRLKEFGYKPLPAAESLPTVHTLPVSQNLPARNNSSQKFSNSSEAAANSNDSGSHPRNDAIESTPVLVSSHINFPRSHVSRFKEDNLVSSLNSSEKRNIINALESTESGTDLTELNSSLASNDKMALSFDNFNTIIPDEYKENEVNSRSTPEEPLLLSLQKRKKLVEESRTPEDLVDLHSNAKNDTVTPEDVATVTYNQDCFPSTPESPVLLSTRRFLV